MGNRSLSPPWTFQQFYPSPIYLFFLLFESSPKQTSAPTLPPPPVPFARHRWLLASTWWRWWCPTPASHYLLLPLGKVEVIVKYFATDFFLPFQPLLPAEDPGFHTSHFPHVISEWVITQRWKSDLNTTDSNFAPKKTRTRWIKTCHWQICQIGYFCIFWYRFDNLIWSQALGLHLELLWHFPKTVEQLFLSSFTTYLWLPSWATSTPPTSTHLSEITSTGITHSPYDHYDHQIIIAAIIMMILWPPSYLSPPLDRSNH